MAVAGVNGGRDIADEEDIGEGADGDLTTVEVDVRVGIWVTVRGRPVNFAAGFDVIGEGDTVE